ncbi:MAG: cyclic-di-AMP receptor [Anaerolineales bacterium]|jgi:uncharacterized protein YaaQ
MKMIVAIIRDSDNDPVTEALINADFRVTRIASTGGFLRHGMSTLMIGVEDEKVEEAIEIIRDSTQPEVEPGIKQATLFVLPVNKFTQL